MRLTNILLFYLLLGCGLALADQAETPKQQAWLDALHAEVSDSVNQTANWFDQFFMEEEFHLQEKAGGEARIKLGWEPRSTELNEFVSRFRVKVNLPNAEHQTDLVFSDYDDEEQNSPIKAASNDAVEQKNRFNLSLRWTSKHDKKRDISHRVGIGRKLQPFVKSRYRRIFELSPSSNLNWETSAYFYSHDGLGAHLMMQYESNLSDDMLFRFDNHFYYRDRENDWVWQHGWYNYVQMNDKNALVYGLYVEGKSQPSYRPEEYLVSVRWRGNALRRWLYFELEPFLIWRRNENFDTSVGLAMRVEGYFGQP